MTRFARNTRTANAILESILGMVGGFKSKMGVRDNKVNKKRKLIRRRISFQLSKTVQVQGGPSQISLNSIMCEMNNCPYAKSEEMMRVALKASSVVAKPSCHP